MTDIQRETVGNVVHLHPAIRRPRAAQLVRPAHAPAETPRLSTDRIEVALAAAALVQAMRDARDTVMPFRLFGEPAWELIIELFLGSRSTGALGIAALCDACSCPERIAAQHLGKLIDAGLVVASPGWTDDEDATAALSPRGYQLAVDIFNVTAPPR